MSLKRLWPYIVFLLITIFLFLPYFKSKKAPIALDIPVGMYYPWLNETYGYAVRPPVKNALITDTVSQFWIWRNRGMSNLKKGVFDHWNPYSFSGYEMSPLFHTILYSPLNLFYFFLSNVDAMSLIVISQIFISLIATYLLGNRLYKSTSLGIFMSISWTMSSFFIGWLTWGTVSFALALTPLALYFWEKYLEKKNKWNFFFTVISVIFLVVSGHPQTIAYCLAIITFWVVFRGRRPVFPYALLVAAIISVPLILPSLKVIQNSIRLQDDSMSSVNFGFIPWTKIETTLLTPSFFGNPATGNYFGSDYNFQEKLTYFGVIPLIFCLYTLIKFFYKKTKSNLFLLSSAFLIIGLALSTQYPFGWIIYHFDLPLLSTSPAGRGFIMSIFGAVLLATHGMSDLRKNKIHLKSLAISSILTLGSICISYLVILATSRYIKESPASLIPFYQPFKSNLLTTARNLIYPVAVIFSFVFAFLVSTRSKLVKKYLVFFIILLTFADSLIFFKKYTPFVPKNLYFPKTPSLDFLMNKNETSTDLFRIERESAELLPPNMWEIYNLRSSSGYDPMAPALYERNLISKGVHGGLSRYFENGQSLDKMGDLGIRYFMVLKRGEAGQVTPSGNIPYYINSKKWTEVFSEGPVSILENTDYKPPYRLANQKNSTLNLKSRSEKNYTFETASPQSNSLIFYENNSPYWKATVDGKQSKIDLFEGSFMALNLSEGKHTVVLNYSDDTAASLRFAFLLLALFFLIIIWF